jgi:hypothetical protein
MQLVYKVVPRELRIAIYHLCKNTANSPNVNRVAVLGRQEQLG